MEQLQAYNYIDIVAAIALMIGMVQGLRRGLSGELARFIAICVAVGCGWYFYHPLGTKLLHQSNMDEQEAYAAAFFLCLIGGFLLMLVIRLLLGHIMEVSFKGPFDRIMGVLAGMLRMGLYCTAIIFFIGLLPNDYLHGVVSESLSGQLVSRYAPEWYLKVRTYVPILPELPEDIVPAAGEDAVPDEDAVYESAHRVEELKGEVEDDTARDDRTDQD